MRIKPFLLLLIFFIVEHDVAAQQHFITTKADRQHNADSLQVINLLKEAAHCVETGNQHCAGKVLQASAVAGRLGSSFLKAACYSSFAKLERNNRTTALLHYDSLCISMARSSSNDSLLCRAYAQISNDFCAVNKPASAKPFLDQLVKLAAPLSNMTLKLSAQYEIAFYYFKRLDFEKAALNYKKALLVAQSTGDDNWAAKAKMMLFFSEISGDIRTADYQNIADALDWFSPAAGIEKANCLYITGQAFKLVGNRTRASRYFSEAGILFHKLNVPLQEAEMCFQLSELYMLDKNYAAGFQQVNKARNLYAAAGYKEGVLKADLSLGRLYRGTGDEKKAGLYFDKVDEALEESPNMQLSMLSAYYRNEALFFKNNNGKNDRMLDSIGKLFAKVIPGNTRLKLVERAASNKIFNPQQAVDMKHYLRTGELDSLLWTEHPGKNEFNPYTGNWQSMDSSYNAVFNRQLTEMETRYRTKSIQDSLQRVTLENDLARTSINRKNWIIILVSLLGVLALALVYQLNRQRKKAVANRNYIALLKQEADHRIGNTLGNINAIISDVKEHAQEPRELELLEERILPLLALYALLNKKKSQAVDLQAYFETICNSLNSSYGSNKKIEVIVDAPVSIKGEKASSLGLIVNELVTNAFKHAFTAGHAGIIKVDCKKNTGAVYHLTVSDNGQGLPVDIAGNKGRGLSQVRALAQQLSAGFHIIKGNGAGFGFIFSSND